MLLKPRRKRLSMYLDWIRYSSILLDGADVTYSYVFSMDDSPDLSDSVSIDRVGTY